MKIAIALSKCSTSGPTSPLWSCDWIERQTTSNQLLESQVGVLAIIIAAGQWQTPTRSESAAVPLGRPGIVVGGLSDLGLTLGGGCFNLLGLSGDAHLRDLEHELVRIHAGRERDPLGQRYLTEADALVDLDQGGDVDVEQRRDVSRHALDLDRGDDLLEHAELELGDCRRFANRDERDLDGQLLAKVDREEVDVHELRGARVDLQLADQDLARATPVECEVDEVAVAGLMPDPLQAARFDRERLGRDVVPIEHRRHLAATPDRVDVTPGLGPEGCAQLEGNCHVSLATLPALPSLPS